MRIILAALLLSGVAAAYAGSITNGSSTDGTPGYITSLVFGAGSAADGLPADDGGGCTGCHVATGNGPTAIALDGVTLSTGTPTSFTVPQGTKRTFTLSSPVQADQVSATYRDGVLEIRIPKAESAKPREIPVQVAES